MLVTAGCPEVLGVMPVKKARDVEGCLHRVIPRTAAIVLWRADFPKTSGYDDDPRELFEIEEVRRQVRAMRFSTQLFFFVTSASPSGAGIARNQDAGVNMNKRESFSIAACSSFGRAAIWS